MPNLGYCFLSHEYCPAFRSPFHFSMAQRLLLLDFYQWGGIIKFPRDVKTHGNTCQACGRQPRPRLPSPCFPPAPPSTYVRACMCMCVRLSFWLSCKWLLLTAHGVPTSAEWVNWHLKAVIARCNAGYGRDWEVRCGLPPSPALISAEGRRQSAGTAVPDFPWLLEPTRSLLNPPTPHGAGGRAGGQSSAREPPGEALPAARAGVTARECVFMVRRVQAGLCLGELSPMNPGTETEAF